jgi:glutamine synthetase
VPGADANPHFVLAAIVALGWRGVEKKLEIPVPPLSKGEDMGGASDQGVRLAKTLKEATVAFMSKDSVAREVFGDKFVDHFGGTREHEVHLWEEAVTDWFVFSACMTTGIMLTQLTGRCGGTSKRSNESYGPMAVVYTLAVCLP